jgi:hypothetical protein
MKQDGNGNIFEDVANIRITYKKQSNRTADKDWAETDVLSFRAYKNADTDALHMGAEVTLKNKETILELIEALCRLYRTTEK